MWIQRNKKKAGKAFVDSNSDVQMKDEEDKNSHKKHKSGINMKNVGETNYYNFYKEDKLDDDFEQIDIS